MRGIEPRAFHMQSERSTTELHPRYAPINVLGYFQLTRCLLTFKLNCWFKIFLWRRNMIKVIILYFLNCYAFERSTIFTEEDSVVGFWCSWEDGWCDGWELVFKTLLFSKHLIPWDLWIRWMVLKEVTWKCQNFYYFLEKHQLRILDQILITLQEMLPVIIFS